MVSCFFDRFGQDSGTLDPLWQSARSRYAMIFNEGRDETLPTFTSRSPHCSTPESRSVVSPHELSKQSPTHTHPHVHGFPPWLCKELSKRPRSRSINFPFHRTETSSARHVDHSSNARRVFSCSSLNSSSLKSLSGEPLGLAREGGKITPVCGKCYGKERSVSWKTGLGRGNTLEPVVGALRDRSPLSEATVLAFLVCYQDTKQTANDDVGAWNYASWHHPWLFNRYLPPRRRIRTARA